jgi:hypothetical protein
VNRAATLIDTIADPQLAAIIALSGAPLRSVAVRCRSRGGGLRATGLGAQAAALGLGKRLRAGVRRRLARHLDASAKVEPRGSAMPLSDIDNGIARLSIYATSSAQRRTTCPRAARHVRTSKEVSTTERPQGLRSSRPAPATTWRFRRRRNDRRAGCRRLDEATRRMRGGSAEPLLAQGALVVGLVCSQQKAGSDVSESCPPRTWSVRRRAYRSVSCQRSMTVRLPVRCVRVSMYRPARIRRSARRSRRV